MEKRRRQKRWVVWGQQLKKQSRDSTHALKKAHALYEQALQKQAQLQNYIEVYAKMAQEPIETGIASFVFANRQAFLNHLMDLNLYQEKQVAKTHQSFEKNKLAWGVLHEKEKHLEKFLKKQQQWLST